MSYTIQAKNLDGSFFNVEVGPGPGAPSVTKVVVERWDNEDAPGSMRYLELHFYMPIDEMFKDETLTVDIRVDAMVDGERRLASDGTVFHRGEHHDGFVAVGTVWGLSSQIGPMFATITSS